ncbi:peptidoglycan-binding domain-containing protein [Streptomyces buecherae]|uniref:peptidoglycan-binding domain-containing protein n=1 Tax=Streptomyces buecherae TaxID=2763006 RepID=UPI0033E41BAE
MRVAQRKEIGVGLALSQKWPREVVAILGVLLVSLNLSTPAHASVAQGAIYGSGTVTDDWGDEGPLSTTQYSFSNAVALWQAVLYADGYLTDWAADGDCRFGAKTRTATIAWQRDRGLSADGIVGPATFGKADDRLTLSGNRVTYHGKVSNLSDMYRAASGRYEDYDRHFSYILANFPICR